MSAFKLFKAKKIIVATACARMQTRANLCGRWCKMSNAERKVYEDEARELRRKYDEAKERYHLLKHRYYQLKAAAAEAKRNAKLAAGSGAVPAAGSNAFPAAWWRGLLSDSSTCSSDLC